jgi:hypothetical protein
VSDGAGIAPPRPGGETSQRQERRLRGRFVGRQDLVADVLDSLQRSGGYETRVILLHGERGIGKTRTAAEVATIAARQGAQAAWGRAGDDAVTPPFHHWEQALRAVAKCVPRVARRLSAVRTRLAATAGESDQMARLAAGEAVVALLSGASIDAPLLVVLDDLHLADAGTMRVLQYVSRHVGEGRFLVLATCRDEAIRRQAELAIALGALDQRTRHVTLAPLDRAAVGDYVRHIVGADADAALVDAISVRSGGNAFFLDKLGGLLAGSPQAVADAGVPAGVREEVLGYRLSGLSADCRWLLHVAAVVGRDCAHEVIEAMLGATGWPLGAGARERILAALNEAIESGLLRPVGSVGGIQFTFVHGLVREALYDGLSLVDRNALHRAAAERLAEDGAPRDATACEELAHHAERSGSRAGLVAAARFAAAAADLYGEAGDDRRAAAFYQRALTALDSSGDLEATRQRVTWLLRLAAAQRRSGERASGRATARRAAECARRIVAADPDTCAALLIDAAVEIDAERAWSRTGVVQDDVIALLQDAMRLLPEGDSGLRARAIAALAGELYHSEFDSGTWRSTAAAEAVSMARRLGDDATLAYTLRNRHIAAWFAETLDGRLRTSAELVSRVRQLPDLRLRAEAHLLRGLDLFEAGDMVQLGREVLFCREAAGQAGNPLMRWHADVLAASHAAFEGRLDEAERLAQLAFEVGQLVQPEDAGLFFGVQMYTLRRLTGDFEQLLPLARDFARQFPTIPIWRIGVADLYAQLGRHAEARAEFEYFAATDFAEPPRDWNWLLAMTLLAEVCAFLGDRARAAVLYEQLLPFANQNVTAVPGLTCIGSTAYQLGLLAAALERPADAVAHFTTAARRNLEMGGLPYAAHVQRAHAALLVQRLEAGAADADASQAAALLAACDDLYARLGIATYGAQTKALAARLADSRRRPIATMPAAAAPCVWRRQRKSWEVRFQGQRAQFRTLRGLGMIAYLIRNAPRAVHVAELESECGTGDAPAPAAGQSSRALQADGLVARRALLETRMLDARALASFRERLRDIAEQLGEAEANSDLGRLERLREERAQLAKAIRDARRPVPADDRVRKRVLRNIRKTALPIIAAKFPDLAAHLSRCLRTGWHCRYQADDRIACVVEAHAPSHTRADATSET